MREYKEENNDKKHVTIIVFLAVIMFLLTILSSLLLCALDEVGYESEEHKKLKDVCMLETEIGCEVKFRPYIEYSKE